ncbi:MFS transporter [Microlunatus sp. Y2014]|uniref:MFS transporter n=1 Tax=Microlunatus sp. Y2014 TaxID=3418488 RepID=UPI003DA78A3C
MSVESRARWAVSALFLTNGAIFANLLPRYPEIKATLGITNAGYGLAVAAFPAGAILAGLGAAALIRRFGSARVAVAGTIATSLAVLAAGFAPIVWLFAAALLIGGATDAITDVAQNAHGLRLQRRYGRSIINSFHAVWSAGAVTGGLMAAGAIALRVPVPIHLGVSAVIFGTVALIALRFCLPGHEERPPATPRSEGPEGTAPAPATPDRPRRLSPRTVITLVALVMIAIGGVVVEDAGSSWAALYLTTSLAAPAAVGALGYTALVAAQFVGRILGDQLVDRFGQRTVSRTGGLITALGMGAALAFPSVPGTIVGFAVAGLGVATVIPAAMHEADELPGLRQGTGLTMVSWLLRLGSLASPPLVGLVADASELRYGLIVVPIAGVAVMVLAQALQGRRPRPVS